MITAGIGGGSPAEPDHDLVAKLRDRFNAATDLETAALVLASKK